MAKIIIVSIRKDFCKNTSFKTNMILIRREICRHKNLSNVRCKTNKEKKTLTEKTFKPIKATQTFYQLGTSSFPAYLSLGEKGMIIEGGTGATFKIMVNQIEELGIDPNRIQFIVLTHTHADHIGAVPRLKSIWPHVKVLASPVAAKTVSKKEMYKDFLCTDQAIAKILKGKGDIATLPPTLQDYSFAVDQVLKDGDTIDLGAGISWTVYHAPGHSPCHVALFEAKEGTLDIGDSTGFYVPEKDVFWPNYFESLEKYCDSIRKLSSIPAQRIVLSHNCVIEGGVKKHFEKALKATEHYHQELIRRVEAGEDSEAIALEKAQWVSSLTDILPFEAIVSLAKLLIKRSQQEVENPNLFIFE